MVGFLEDDRGFHMWAHASKRPLSALRNLDNSRMTSSADAAGFRRITSASQWQRENGQAAVDWFWSSGGAQRMLDDVCRAVEMTVDLLVGDSADRAREILVEYPQVLRRCDQLTFDEQAQAVAYLILHLPDRYCRLFHVLERLLASGRLPIGKNNRFAAIDIGAAQGQASLLSAASTPCWLGTLPCTPHRGRSRPSATAMLSSEARRCTM